MTEFGVESNILHRDPAKMACNNMFSFTATGGPTYFVGLGVLFKLYNGTHQSRIRGYRHISIVRTIRMTGRSIYFYRVKGRHYANRKLFVSCAVTRNSIKFKGV